jgi:phosphate transport system substrate-binding protein
LQRKKLVCLTVAAVFASTMSAFAASASAGTLTGAGSTLVAPLEAYWNQGWSSATGNSVTFSAVGSGTGITDISKSEVNFGASDAPMSTAQAAGCANCIQIPWALSATGIGYNIPGIRTLKLNGSVLAGIYLGTINNWDNPAIAHLNKGEHFPNLAITPVHRTDGSGDTYAFTNYLGHVSSSWAREVGPPGTSVSFKAGVGNSGNLGVTTTLQNTKGAIAYIAVSYLLAHGVHVAAVQNTAGKFEYPNLSNIEDAAKFPTTVPNGYSIVDPPKKAKTAYPISTFTYVIAPTNSSVGSLLQSFINYALTTGQQYGPRLDFAPMPKGILNAAKAAVGRIQ